MKMLKSSVVTLFFFIFFNRYKQIKGLQLTSVAVPEVVDMRDVVTLSCSYDLGTHKMNSVKWYKDGSEFYRYAPMMNPTIMTFYIDGIHLNHDTLNVCNQFTCSIRLDRLNTKTSGQYRCEVSGDAPEFKIAHETNNMTVAALPRQDPVMTGLQRSYSLNDFVVANCTTDMSSPAAKLTWYVNDDVAPSNYLQPMHETSIEADGFDLRYRSVEIRFHIDSILLGDEHGKVKLKCVAVVENFPRLVRETISYIYVPSMEELRNQKLTNWRNSAATKPGSQMVLSIFYYLAFVSLLSQKNSIVHCL